MPLDWLPTQMGIYLARMHRLKIQHQFTHAQNWSLVGTLYDLDSPRGEPYGREMSEEDYDDDIRRTLLAITGAYSVSKSYLGSLHLKGQALESFVTAYIQGRFGSELTLADLYEIMSSHFVIGNPNVDMENIWKGVRRRVSGREAHIRSSG